MTSSIMGTVACRKRSRGLAGIKFRSRFSSTIPGVDRLTNENLNPAKPKVVQLRQRNQLANAIEVWLPFLLPSVANVSPQPVI